MRFETSARSPSTVVAATAMTPAPPPDYSKAIGASAFKFVAFKELLEADGYTVKIAGG